MCVCVCVFVYVGGYFCHRFSRPASAADDVGDYGDDAVDDVSSDVTGRLMTCTGLTQLPMFVPLGVSVCLSVCDISVTSRTRYIAWS